MSQSSEIQKIIGQIQQLRALAKSTHSRAEAEVCIATAAKLIAKFQLEEAEIAAQTGKSSEGIDVVNEHIIYETGRSTPWKTELVWGLAKLNGLFAYSSPIRDSVTHRRGKRYRVIGRLSDIQLGTYMFEYLTTTISQMVNDYIPTGAKRGVNPNRESWCLGCVRGFLAKMKVERDAVNQLGSSTALVFIGNKAKEAEEAFKKSQPDIKWTSTIPSKANITSTFESGYRKGQTLTINQGMGGANTTKSLHK